MNVFENVHVAPIRRMQTMTGKKLQVEITEVTKNNVHQVIIS